MKLRFVTCHDIVSAAIRTAEFGFWASHVEAVIPDGRLLGAHFKGGVQARMPGYDADDVTRQLFITLPATAEMDIAFHVFLEGQLGKPYDVDAIAALVAERDWAKPDAWFCSELIAAGLRHCGWFASDLAVGFAKITPRDLMLIISGRIPIESDAVAA